MSQEIAIIDCGRGPQLSTTRITVLDLLPYFQSGCSDEEMMRWLPTLTTAEISVARQYYATHQLELDEADREVREYREREIAKQRLRFPESHEDSQQRFTRLKQLLDERRQEKNGERHPA